MITFTTFGRITDQDPIIPSGSEGGPVGPFGPTTPGGPGPRTGEPRGQIPWTPGAGPKTPPPKPRGQVSVPSTKGTKKDAPVFRPSPRPKPRDEAPLVFNVRNQGEDTVRIPPPPPAPDVSRYPPGSFTRFNVTRSVWSVYSPLAGGLAGLGADVEPPVPTGFVKVAEEVVPPADVPKAGEETDKRPWYKNPYVWLAVGGTVVVGGGTIYMVRRRRAA